MNLLFDLDDTLYPEKQYIFQGFWAVSNYIGDKFSIDKKQIYLQIISLFRNGSNKVIDDIILELKLNENPFFLLDVYRRSQRRLSFYSEVKTALKHLKEDGNDIILLTNGNSEAQWNKIKILEADELFDEIYVLDDFGKEFWKPSTLILKKIYNVHKGKELCEYVLVGNNSEDLQFAINAGIGFIFVDRNDALRKVEKIEYNKYLGKIMEITQLVNLIR